MHKSLLPSRLMWMSPTLSALLLLALLRAPAQQPAGLARVRPCANQTATQPAAAQQTTRAKTLLSQAVPRQQAVDVRCPRFAYVNITSLAGLGHRFAEVVLGMQFAFENDATFVFPDNAFSGGNSQHGSGSYAWMDDVVPFARHFPTLSAVEAAWRPARQYSGLWQDAAAHRGACGVLLTTCGECCNTWSVRPVDVGFDFVGRNWCQTTKVETYNSAKVPLRRIFDLKAACPEPPVYADVAHELVVVWHLRVSWDLTLHTEARTLLASGAAEGTACSGHCSGVALALVAGFECCPKSRHWWVESDLMRLTSLPAGGLLP